MTCSIFNYCTFGHFIIIYQVSACQCPSNEPADACERCEYHDNSVAKPPESVGMISVFEVSLRVWGLNLESAFDRTGNVEWVNYFVTNLLNIIFHAHVAPIFVNM